MKKIFFLLLTFLLITPVLVSAEEENIELNEVKRVSVAVDTTKIVIDDILRIDSEYDLPSIKVTNNGEVASYYTLTIEDFDEEDKSDNLNPKVEWFTFVPDSLYLEPDESKEIKIKLNLPSNIQPGDYSTLLVATLGEDPKVAAERESSGVSLGLAAATKLYFTVDSSNFFQTMYYDILKIFENNKPWSTVIVIAIPLIILGIFASKSVDIKKKED